MSSTLLRLTQRDVETLIGHWRILETSIVGSTSIGRYSLKRGYSIFSLPLSGPSIPSTGQGTDLPHT